MVTVIKCSVPLPQRCTAWPVSVISVFLSFTRSLHFPLLAPHSLLSILVSLPNTPIALTIIIIMTAYLTLSLSFSLVVSLSLWCEITVNSTIWLLWTVIDHAAGPNSLLYLADTQCVVLGGWSTASLLICWGPLGRLHRAAPFTCIAESTKNKTEILKLQAKN